MAETEVEVGAEIQAFVNAMYAKGVSIAVAYRESEDFEAAVILPDGLDSRVGASKAVQDHLNGLYRSVQWITPPAPAGKPSD